MASQAVKPQALTLQERQLRAEWLAKLGVPTPFRDAIIDAPTDWLTAWGGAVLGIAMVAVAIGTMVAGFMWLDAHVTARAVAEAAQTGASLVYVNVGMGPFILLFGIAALGGWAFNVFATRYRV